MNCRLTGTFVLSLTFAGCAVPNQADLVDVEMEASAERLIWEFEGTPEGVAILNLLNHRIADVDFLDNEVGLNKRAAENLADYRVGSDGQWGTDDDVRFDLLTDVDAVYWVGPQAMQSLFDYANDNGFTPEGDDFLGRYDNIDFSVNDARAVIDVVNWSNTHLLDQTVGLNSRAVASIIDNRPVGTVLELSDLYWIGPSTLTRLKDFSTAE